MPQQKALFSVPWLYRRGSKAPTVPAVGFFALKGSLDHPLYL